MTNSEAGAGEASLGYYYLGSPYSSPDPRIVEWRVKTTMGALAWLRRSEIVAYSPILHWHHTAQAFALPTDAKSWEQQNIAMQRSASKGLIVLGLPGWRDSTGLQQEINWALEWGQQIRELQPTQRDDGTLGWLLMHVEGDPRA